MNDNTTMPVLRVEGISKAFSGMPIYSNREAGMLPVQNWPP